MTREEARVLLKYLNYQLTAEFYDGGFWVEEGTFEAFEVADAALREKQQRQPDPITGLVPCGCGGVAERLKLGYQRAVACKNGHVFTGWKDTQKQADDMWNTAMGWKGGAE